MKMAANFSEGDLFVTLTYDEQHTPASRKDAVACIRAWIRETRSEFRQHGTELKYLYCTENKHGGGRYHHHVIMNHVERAEEFLKAFWVNGCVDIKDIDERRLDELARYFTKEAADTGRKVGQRAWTTSKNLKSPEVETCFVPDNFSISLPPGCQLIENPSMRNYFGEYSYMEYLTPPKGGIHSN